MSYFFELGGISVPIQANLGLRQEYRALGGRHKRRMADGSLHLQSNWSKIATTISGDGWVPAGFAGLDFDSALTLKCLAPRSIISASNVLTIPATRRSDGDYLPVGYATVDGERVATPLALVSNTATLTLVSGAQFYEVVYYPELQVYADPPTEQTDAHSAQFRWSITAEQI